MRLPSPLAGMVVATALAGGLSLYQLGSRSLWLDEGFTFAAASQHGSHLLTAALKDGGNAVSYYLGMHYWIALFGSAEFSLRAPTAIAAIGTVPACFYLLKRLFDPRAAVFGALFVAVSVGFTWWAQNARSYVVGAFLVCASTLALVVGIQRGRRLAWAAYVVLSALAVYTVVLTALVLVAQLASLLLLPRRTVEGRVLGVSASAMALLTVPLVWVFADHGTGPAQWASAPGAVLGKNNRYLFEFLASARSVGVPFNQSIVDCVVIGMVLCWSLAACRFVVGLARSRRTPESWGLGLLLAWFVFPTLATYLISVWIQPVLSDRYILAALPPASMLAGVVVSWLRPWPLAVATGLALLVLRAWLIMPGYGVPLENWRQGVLDVTARSQPKDCIAFFVSDGYTAFDYYVEHLKSLPGPTPTPVLPASSWQSRTPYALDPQPIPAARMPEVVASCPRLWLVDSHAAGASAGPGIPGYRVRVYQADHALLTELDASYRETSAWWFRGAHVFLYVRDP